MLLSEQMKHRFLLNIPEKLFISVFRVQTQSYTLSYLKRRHYNESMNWDDANHEDEDDEVAGSRWRWSHVWPLMGANIEQGQSHLYHTHLSIIIIEHRNRQEPSVSYSPLHDHQEHRVHDNHRPSNKARAISIILSTKVFFMIITIIIEYRNRPYQPTCSDKDIRFHSDPQSSMA